ncbi:MULTISPECIES: protein phosphatase CheZ [unclassified Polaromonas]|jgi:chemotaxis protein CheZ|uniref:protein phosphatase CheZ n=1 Tax=unclassified Polaromonas TaxID=2638319 RepID=UPI0018C9698C|nr:MULTISPECIES: protein phosphatase CheZ [unclassified Polaromonas]
MAQENPSIATVPDSAEQLLHRIGQLTRQMRESIRELGLDKGIAKVADAIPDARDRLGYIAQMTERAAERALNAIDVAQPIQDDLARQAKDLTQRWDAWFESPVDLDEARELVLDNRAYLRAVPQQVSATNAQLMEIMMAQDFQDLTGQVIKKMMNVINDMDTQLLQLLIDNKPLEKRPESNTNLLHGPEIKPQQPDAVGDQAQVDDLLASLGF